MSKTDDTHPKAVSAQVALDGYWYQVKVSILFALDVLTYDQTTDRIVLEPPSEEDLETDIENASDALTQIMTVGSRRLVVQCKRKTTGPWTEGDLRRLLSHGTKRIKPSMRLNDPKVSYLLVTSADLVGVARQLSVEGPTQWSRVPALPKKIAKLLPENAAGRLAVWNALDDEKLDYRIAKRLTDRFRVPHGRVDQCIEKLRDDALLRMSGAGNGIWTRDQVIKVIRDNGGYDGVSSDVDGFVHPSNWNMFKEQLANKHAVVIAGPSGTGKTETAKALIVALRDEIPGIRHLRVQGGPEQIRDDDEIGPVIYEIEDPWGKYQLNPNSQPWNDSINAFLASASPDRKYVITSRSDMMKEAGLKTLDDRFAIKLLDDHYTARDRHTLFENRLTKLPYSDQVAALKYKTDVIDTLFLPLEIERFFSGILNGPLHDENEATHMRRCLDEAKQGAIESSLVGGIRQRQLWAQVAVIWALLKSRKRIPIEIFGDLEWVLAARDTIFEDKLETLVDFLTTGRNLKQNGSILSCAHPRVEAGLEQAVLEKPKLASRAITDLAESLIELDESSNSDWWLETAVHVCAAANTAHGLRLKMSISSQKKVDEWLENKVAELGTGFRDDLKLAIAAGSTDCAVAELARWLDDSPIDRGWANMMSWKEPERSEEWYTWIAAESHTEAICAAFIVRILGFKNGFFRGNFHTAVAKFSANLTPAFREAIGSLVTNGHFTNVGTLISGAVVDIDAFETVVSDAADFSDNSLRDRDRSFWLAIKNHDYDDYAADHFMESAGEEGYTATEILKAYITARRKNGDWKLLAQHPRRSSFLWEWINCAGRDDNTEEAEVVALGVTAAGHIHEQQFWILAHSRFNPDLIELLQNRLNHGSDDPEVRLSAVATAMVHSMSLISNLFTSSSTIDAARKLELVIDLDQAMQDEEKTIADRKTIFSELMTGMEASLKGAAEFILDFHTVDPMKASLAILSSTSETLRPEVGLSIAKALARSGVDVSSRLRHLLTAQHEISDKNIETVCEAMQLAIDLNIKTLIELGLKNDFAKCRVLAISAISDLSEVPMPERLLAMKADKSSLVRLRLLELLETNPHEQHIPTLIAFTSDDWTPDQHHHGYPISHPIAEKAADLLLLAPTIVSEHYPSLIEALKSASNDDVKQTLLQVMVRHGLPPRQSKIIQKAVSGDRPPYPLLCAKALFFEREHVEKSLYKAIEDKHVLGVRPAEACWLALLITYDTSDERLIDMAGSLAVNPNRRSLNVLLYLSSFEEGRGHLRQQIAVFLPEAIVESLQRVVATRDTSDLRFLDDFGDVRTVELVKYYTTTFCTDADQST